MPNFEYRSLKTRQRVSNRQSSMSCPLTLRGTSWSTMALVTTISLSMRLPQWVLMLVKNESDSALLIDCLQMSMNALRVIFVPHHQDYATITLQSNGLFKKL